MSRTLHSELLEGFQELQDLTFGTALMNLLLRTQLGGVILPVPSECGGLFQLFIELRLTLPQTLRL